MILVDTNVWSELTKKQPSENVRRWEAANAAQLWMSAIVLAEFRAGVALMPEGKKRTGLELRSKRSSRPIGTAFSHSMNERRLIMAGCCCGHGAQGSR